MSPCLLAERCLNIGPSYVHCYAVPPPQTFANESSTISGHSFMKGDSQAFHYGPTFYGGSELMSPQAPIHRNNTLKAILFVLQ
jgi:hypothetical protein